MVYKTLKSDVLRLSVVSEDQTIVESISQLLQCSSFEQTELRFIQSLEEAITQSFKSQADILLLDLAVLKEQALEISQSLLPALVELPLLILCDAEQYTQQFINSTVKTVLLKETLSPITLSHALQQVLEQKRSQQHLQEQIHQLSRKVNRLECALDNALLSVHQLYENTAILEGILDTIPDAIVFADSKRRVCKVNPAFSHIFEYSAESVLGNTTEQLYESSSRYYHQEKQRYNIDGNSHISVYEECYRRQGGEVFIGKTVGRVVKDRFDYPLGYLGIIRDISKHREIELALQQSEAINQALLQVVPDQLLWMRQDGSYLKVKEQLLTGKDALQVAEGNIYDYLPSRLAQQQLHYVRRAIQTGESQIYEQQIYWEQRACYEKVHIVPHDADSALVVVRDITQQKRLEQQLYAEKELAQITLQSIGDAVITTDAQGIITYLNPIAEELTGWRQQDAQGLALAEVFIILNEYTRELVQCPVNLVLQKGIAASLAKNTILVAKDGRERSIEDSAAPIRNGEGQIVGTILVFHDVTEARQLASQLTWQASHDEITQLMNRRQFEQELAELLHTPQKGSSVLCYLDLDQFKLVNDTCSHAAGDALLRQVSDILVGQVRLTDTVARLGGDEFAVLLHQCSLEFARRIANLMCQSVREFRFVHGERSFSVSVSIGLVEITHTNHSLAEVLAAADGACYAAKEAGRNRVHVYRADDLNLSHQRNQQQWCLQIDKALEEDRFQLYHQPIAAVDNTQGEYHHTELLLRLLDQEGQTIPPGAFIPAAERYHRMPAVDQWVIQRFLTEMSQVKVNSQMLYNINLSGASLSDERFLRTLKKRLKQSKINPAQICFEVTETAAISNLTRVSAFMSSLKQLGCQFALDDFGSGMSSFGYLRQLPVDYIKIDGSFIQKIEDPINKAIVKSICSVGQAMNIQIIAEWVESKEICSQLKELGVNYVQGYGIARPRLLSKTKSFD
ncbi:EAL domain-containing protein [Sphaerothrix gracilis]|uniref:EAL domain-containing protein n=1 Tax=Sphaerothrix gracilis TaxID=3151835 RepID=UPI0031FD9938